MLVREKPSAQLQKKDERMLILLQKISLDFLSQHPVLESDTFFSYLR